MADNVKERDNKDAQESGRPVQLDREPQQGGKPGQQQPGQPERRPDTEQDKPLGQPHPDRPQHQNR